jgi:hypothetical protein
LPREPTRPGSRPRLKRAALVGAGLALAYVATVGITLGLHPGRVRPLYEGFTPPSTYHWVNPPHLFAAANQRPTVTHASVKLGPAGSVATGISTDDAQLVLGMAAGAVPRHGSDTSVAVTIIPLDPATLAPVPSPYRANGNAYLVAMAYRPSGVAVTRLAGSGASMVLIVPEVGHQLFTTTASHGPWATVVAHSIPPTDLTLGATMRAPGYYLAGTTLPPLAFAGRSSTAAAAINVGVGVLAVLVIGGGALLIRRRRRRSTS